MSRSEIIADKSAFTPDDTHRCGEILTCPHQQSIQTVRAGKPLFRSSNSRHNAAMIATAGYYRYKPEENLFPAKCESRQYALMIRRPDA